MWFCSYQFLHPIMYGPTSPLPLIARTIFTKRFCWRKETFQRSLWSHLCGLSVCCYFTICSKHKEIWFSDNHRFCPGASCLCQCSCALGKDSFLSAAPSPLISWIYLLLTQPYIYLIEHGDPFLNSDFPSSCFPPLKTPQTLARPPTNYSLWFHAENFLMVHCKHT